jgi:hypothetical protein
VALPQSSPSSPATCHLAQSILSCTASEINIACSCICFSRLVRHHHYPLYSSFVPSAYSTSHPSFSAEPNSAAKNQPSLRNSPRHITMPDRLAGHTSLQKARDTISRWGRWCRSQIADWSATAREELETDLRRTNLWNTSL